MRLPFTLCWLLVAGCNVVAGIDDAEPRAAPSATSAGSGGTGSGDASGNGPPATCMTHSDCLQGATAEFDPYACVQGACVRLFSDECQQMLPFTNKQWLANLRNSDAEPLIFGTFALSSQHGISDASRNFDLMLTEVANSVKGLPTADGKRRPLVGVVCNSGTFAEPLTSDALNREVDHLTVDLGVPAILSSLESSDLAQAFQYRGSERHVFFMNVYGAEQNIQAITADGLIWSILPPGTDLVPVYQPLLDRTIEHLRTVGTLGANEDARVAIVVAQNVDVLNEIGSALMDTLKFNGKSAQDNFPAAFLPLIVSSQAGGAASDDTDSIQSLRDFKPHVVISMTGNEFVTDYIPLLEATKPSFEPMYLLSLWEYGDPSQLQQLIRPTNVDLHTRIAGVNYAAAPDQTVYDKYQLRFDAQYQIMPEVTGFENFYDGAYYFFYAAAAAGTVWPLGGPDLVNGMRRLLSGRSAFDVGPEALPMALTALGTPGSSITLNGAMGPPNFDPKTGVRHTPGSVYCLDETGQRHADVLTLDSDGNLVGDFPCFDF